MADTNLTHDQEMHVESHAPYIKVWAALAVLTLIEYLYAKGLKDAFAALVIGLMFWAVIKASLVGWFFMHLKFEGKWVYAMLIPAAMLAMVFIFALIPDIGMHEPEIEPSEEDDATVSAPLNPGKPGGINTLGVPIALRLAHV
jgi:cytochrome c oxidase subunit 4